MDIIVDCNSDTLTISRKGEKDIEMKVFRPTDLLKILIEIMNTAIGTDDEVNLIKVDEEFRTTIDSW